MRYQTINAIIVIFVCSTAQALAASSLERSVAIAGCKMAILDGAIKEYAKRAGENPKDLTTGFKKKMLARIETEKPEAIRAIEANCACVIDYFNRKEGSINGSHSAEMFRKHGRAVLKECPPPTFK